MLIRFCVGSCQHQWGSTSWHFNEVEKGGFAFVCLAQQLIAHALSTRADCPHSVCTDATPVQCSRCDGGLYVDLPTPLHGRTSSTLRIVAIGRYNQFHLPAIISGISRKQPHRFRSKRPQLSISSPQSTTILFTPCFNRHTDLYKPFWLRHHRCRRRSNCNFSHAACRQSFLVSSHHIPDISLKRAKFHTHNGTQCSLLFEITRVEEQTRCLHWKEYIEFEDQWPAAASAKVPFARRSS